jgi:(S)-ureidoglycine aminohydrolase
VRRTNHALHTPDTFIRTQIPGMTKAAAVIHASPALGAAFTQYTAEMEVGGTLGACAYQRFLYVLEGRLEIEHGSTGHEIATGDYAYLPQGVACGVLATEAARIAVIEKKYLTLDSIDAPESIF